MPRSSSSAKEENLTSLVGDIAREAGTLLAQETNLLRAEVKQELHRASEGAVDVAAGAGLAAAGGFLSGMMLAHFLQRTTGLPLWICYGVVGGSMSAASVTFLKQGK